MTLFKVKRSQVVETMVLSLVALVGLCGQSLALTIISPTQSSAVREKVRIVIPRTTVPTDGFVAIKIDGKFRVAAALPEEIKNPKKGSADSPYYTYIWDTKAPVLTAGPSAEVVNIKDGKHTLGVEVHNSMGRTVDGAKVDVVLKNKVPLPTPPPSFKLYYKYHLGEASVYHCRVEGDVLDNLGQPLLSGVSAVKADFDIVQSVEDVRSDGTALVRYKLGKDALAEVFGHPVSLQNASTSFPSIYKDINRWGKVIDSDVIHKTNATVTDVMPVLPSKKLQLGEGWSSTFKIKVEGLDNAAIVPFQMSNTLDSIEWESGRECARIESSMTALGKMNILPGTQGTTDQTPAKGTGTFYISYKTGKLIKANALLDTTMSIDQATLTALQQGTYNPGSSGPTTPSGYGLPPALANYAKQTQDALDYAMNPDSEIQKPQPTPGYGTPGTTGPATTTIRLRLNWSLEFKK